MESDAYRVLAGPSVAEIKVKGSRFIAEAIPVESEEQAVAAISERKRKLHDATHHCSAFRIGSERQSFRWNDDGEPSGSAGRPILRQIDSVGVTNVVIVVTRYYGGVKLGTGGLARAYGQAAASALGAASIEQKRRTVNYQIQYGYRDTAAVVAVVAGIGGRVVSTAYDDRITQIIAVPCSMDQHFCSDFQNAVAGRGHCEQGPISGDDGA